MIVDGCCDRDNDGWWCCEDDGGEQRLVNLFLKLLLSDVVVDILVIFFVDLDSYDVVSAVVVSSSSCSFIGEHNRSSNESFTLMGEHGPLLLLSQVLQVVSDLRGLNGSNDVFVFLVNSDDDCCCEEYFSLLLLNDDNTPASGFVVGAEESTSMPLSGLVSNISYDESARLGGTDVTDNNDDGDDDSRLTSFGDCDRPFAAAIARDDLFPFLLLPPYFIRPNISRTSSFKNPPPPPRVAATATLSTGVVVDVVVVDNLLLMAGTSSVFIPTGAVVCCGGCII